MKCDGCTLCCELLNIPWVNSPAGELCKHCNVGLGCNIFDAVDEDCKDYQCAYFQMDNVSTDLRPDKCGVLFEKVSNLLFVGIIDPKHKFKDIVKDQISDFLNNGYSVILKNKEKPIIINTKDRTKESVWFELHVIESERKRKLGKN